MLELLFSLGQAAAALLVLYGGYLAVGQAMSSRSRRPNPALEDQPRSLEHSHTDA